MHTTKPKLRFKKIKHLKIYLWVIFVLYLLTSAYTIADLSLPSTASGIRNMQAGQDLILKNPKEASPYFEEASKQFNLSFERMRSAPLWVKILTPIPPFRYEVRLIKASSALSKSGQITAELAKNFPTLNTKDTEVSALVSQTSSQYFQWFNQNTSQINELSGQISTANKELKNIPSWILFKESAKFKDLQNKIEKANKAVYQTIAITNELERSFAKDQPGVNKNYMLVFQNDAELRDTGGFLGSYAILNTSGGFIRQFSFGKDIYKLELNPVDKTFPTPPEPLTFIFNKWSFRDSNILAGFLSEASPQVVAQYKRTTGQDINGIMYLDCSVLVDLLKIIGPVKLPISGTEVSAENIRNELTKEVEKNYFSTEENKSANEPKQIIYNLIPQIVEKTVQSKVSLNKYAQLLTDAVNRKSIQFWSKEPETQKLIESLTPLDSPTNGNWLKIVNCNLGGMKSSLNMKQEVFITTQIDKNSKKINQEIKIIRTHQGNGVWPDSDNHNYLEIYLPKTASINKLPTTHVLNSPLSPETQTIYGVKDKIWKTQTSQTERWQKIELWASTKVGEISEYTFSYSLPLNSENQKSLLYIKQAGSQNEYVKYNNKDTVLIKQNYRFNPTD